MSSADVGVMASGSGTVIVGDVHVSPSGVSVTNVSQGEIVVGASTNNTGLSLGEGVSVFRFRIDRHGHRCALVTTTRTDLPSAGKRKRLGPGGMVKRSQSSVYVYGTRIKITPGDCINGVKVGRRYKISGDRRFSDRLIVSHLPTDVVAAIDGRAQEDASAGAAASASEGDSGASKHERKEEEEKEEAEE